MIEEVAGNAVPSRRAGSGRRPASGRRRGPDGPGRRRSRGSAGRSRRGRCWASARRNARAGCRRPRSVCRSSPASAGRRPRRPSGVSWCTRAWAASAWRPTRASCGQFAPRNAAVSVKLSAHSTARPSSSRLRLAGVELLDLRIQLGRDLVLAVGHMRAGTPRSSGPPFRGLHHRHRARFTSCAGSSPCPERAEERSRTARRRVEREGFSTRRRGARRSQVRGHCTVCWIVSPGWPDPGSTAPG